MLTAQAHGCVPSAASGRTVAAKMVVATMPCPRPFVPTMPVCAMSHMTGVVGVQPRGAAIPRAAMLDAPAAISSFASMMDSEEEEPEVVRVDASLQDESLRVENLGLCEETVAAMYKRGIQSLFPIQKSVFLPIQDGRDLIGRAKTGSGKTLAFALPVVEAILKEDKENKAAGVKRGRSRAPRCIILAPTRELANQVAREFETVCPTLSVVSVYGGVAIGGNIRDLERGADVVVGTPGRVIDLIERDSLKLDKIRYAILDEADQMLDMGFEEDMEKILSYVPEKRQTLLFSATLPKWVNKVARRFQTNPLLVDLVGEENTGRLADTIKLQVMQVDWSQKTNALMDVITLHAAAGKTIVFVNTKVKADEVCDAVSQTHPAMALHGDISQAMRDRSLAMFREGKFPVLVATDVAARGLDIPNVDLVCHYDVPLDNESFLHRSGRTGRAGKTGTAVVLFTEKEVRSLGLILRQTKVDNAELVGAPEPREVLARAAKGVLTQLDKVDGTVIDFFIPAAEKLMSSEQPTRVLAAALAALGGFRAAPQPRSLLTYEEGFVTLRLMGSVGAGSIDGFRSLNMALRAITSKAKVKKELEYSLGKVKVISDRAAKLSGAAFDLPTEEALTLVNNPAIVAAAEKMGYTLDRPKALPLDVGEMMSSGERGGRFGRGGDRGGYRSGDDDGRSSRGRYGGGFRGGDRGDRGSSYGSREGSRGGYGSREGGGYGGRDSAGGGYGVRDSGRGGRDSGVRREGGGYGAARTTRGASSPAGGAWGNDSFYDPAGDAGYFNNSGNGNGGAAKQGGATRAQPAFTNPKDGGWAQW